MQPAALTPAARMQAAASVGIYAKWRELCTHWHQQPYERGTDMQRRETCGQAIAANLDRLGGLGAVW